MPQIQFLVNFEDNTVLHSFKVDTLEQLKDGLRASYPALGAFTISYYDDEGDCIKVTSQPEFAEALNAAQDNGDFLSIILNTESQASEASPAPQVESALPPSPFDFLNNLLGGRIAAAQPLVQNFFQNAEAAGSELPGFLEEAAQNLLPLIQNGIKDIEPLLRNVGEEISAAAERASSAVQAEVAQHRIPPNVCMEPEIVPEKRDIEDEQPQVEVQRPVAHFAICDCCEKNIFGIRYKCLNCPDYDLCEVCEATNLEKNTHDSEHVFAKIYRTEQRYASIFRHGHMQRGGRCGAGKFGGRRRIDKAEKDIEVLQQQIADLLAKKNAQESREPVPEEEPLVEPQEEEVIIEDVIEEEPASAEVPVPEEPAISESTQQILNMLSQMGFNDQEANLAVITAHEGNVEMVLESLLNGDF